MLIVRLGKYVVIPSKASRRGIFGKPTSITLPLPCTDFRKDVLRDAVASSEFRQQFTIQFAMQCAIDCAGHVLVLGCLRKLLTRYLDIGVCHYHSGK